MVQRLAEQGLVTYRPYHGARLTDLGRRVALEMLRHHRLLETFLERVLGYGWEEVHEEAERLEHVISERFEARIAETLGHPTHDPHGDPIPDAELRMPSTVDEFQLAEMAFEEAATLLRVGSQDRDILHRLGHMGLVPGVEIRVLSTGDDGVMIEVDNNHHLLPHELGRVLWLRGNS
jgi:DtxR family Mn-dependent transcriptional regulator